MSLRRSLSKFWGRVKRPLSYLAGNVLWDTVTSSTTLNILRATWAVIIASLLGIATWLGGLAFWQTILLGLSGLLVALWIANGVAWLIYQRRPQLVDSRDQLSTAGVRKKDEEPKSDDHIFHASSEWSADKRTKRVRWQDRNEVDIYPPSLFALPDLRAQLQEELRQGMMMLERGTTKHAWAVGYQRVTEQEVDDWEAQVIRLLEDARRHDLVAVFTTDVPEKLGTLAGVAWDPLGDRLRHRVGRLAGIVNSL